MRGLALWSASPSFFGDSAAREILAPHGREVIECSVFVAIANKRGACSANRVAEDASASSP